MSTPRWQRLQRWVRWMYVAWGAMTLLGVLTIALALTWIVDDLLHPSQPMAGLGLGLGVIVLVLVMVVTACLLLLWRGVVSGLTRAAGGDPSRLQMVAAASSVFGFVVVSAGYPLTLGLALPFPLGAPVYLLLLAAAVGTPVGVLVAASRLTRPPGGAPQPPHP